MSTSVNTDCFVFIIISCDPYFWVSSSHLSNFILEVTQVHIIDNQFVSILSLIAFLTSLSDTALYELLPVHTVVFFQIFFTSFITAIIAVVICLISIVLF